jgi:hypothetical protein
MYWLRRLQTMVILEGPVSARVNRTLAKKMNLRSLYLPAGLTLCFALAAPRAAQE